MSLSIQDHETNAIGFTPFNLDLMRRLIGSDVIHARSLFGDDLQIGGNEPTSHHMRTNCSNSILNFDKYLYELDDTDFINLHKCYDFDCPICNDVLLIQDCCTDTNSTKNDNLVECYLSCGHKFHKTCISQWFRNKLHCPYCRQIPMSRQVNQINQINQIDQIEQIDKIT